MAVSIRKAAVLTAFCLGLPLGAQKIVSPVGDIDPSMPGDQYLSVYEGNKRFVDLFGRSPLLPPPFHTGETRFQQVDGEFTGDKFRGKSLKNITFRRDAFVVYEDMRAFPRVIWLHVVVGPGTYNDFGKNFNANFYNQYPYYKTSIVGSGSSYKAFSLPDLRNAPPSMPAPWLVPIPFDRPYVIPDTGMFNWNSFVYEIQATGVVSGNYPFDLHEAVNCRNQSSELGVGCVVDGHTRPMTLRVVGDMHPAIPEYCFNFDIDDAPAVAPVVILAGMEQWNFPIPGLCTNLFLKPTASFPIGVTNPTGFLHKDILTPWLDFYDGQHIVFQAVAPDPTQRFPLKYALSNAEDHFICASSPKVKSLWSHFNSASTGDLMYAKAVVTGFDE